MKNKITIEFDTEQKTINKVEIIENESPLDIAKILISVALSNLNKIEIKSKSKIQVVKPKIIGVKK